MQCLCERGLPWGHVDAGVLQSFQRCSDKQDPRLLLLRVSASSTQRHTHRIHTLATLHSENECGPTFVSRDARSPVHGGVAMCATEARSLPVRVPVPCTPTYPEM